MTKKEVIDLLSSFTECIEHNGYSRSMIETDAVFEIIDKIFEEPIIDCSFNNLVNSTIIIR